MTFANHYAIPAIYEVREFVEVGGLIIAGPSTRELAQTAVQMMRDTEAPDARFFDADMREPSAIIAMMDEIKAWGGPDILVNNAGIQETASLLSGAKRT